MTRVPWNNNLDFFITLRSQINDHRRYHRHWRWLSHFVLGLHWLPSETLPDVVKKKVINNITKETVETAISCSPVSFTPAISCSLVSFTLHWQLIFRRRQRHRPLNSFNNTNLGNNHSRSVNYTPAASQQNMNNLSDYKFFSLIAGVSYEYLPECSKKFEMAQWDTIRGQTQTWWIWRSYQRVLMSSCLVE